MNAAFVNLMGGLIPANYTKHIASFAEIMDLGLFQIKALASDCLMSVVVRLNTLNGETVVIPRMGG